MIVYAPAWLRRWRKPLVPILFLAGVTSYLALFWLPPFVEAVVPHMVCALVGAFACSVLLLLLNGEPLPNREAFETTTLNSGEGEIVEFVAHYSVESATKAQAEFWRRSVRELRMGSEVVPPAALAFFSALSWKLAPDLSIWVFFTGLTALSIVMLVIRFLVGKHAAAVRARREPDRRIRIASVGITASATDVALAWSNVVRVWESQAFLTLVLNPYMAIQLPKASTPPEARAIILRATASASDRQDR